MTGEKEFSKEEEDLLKRSKRRSKDQEEMDTSQPGEDSDQASKENMERRSYRDSVLGYGKRRNIQWEELDDGYVSDDDLIE